jgi:hypothetical protein
VHAWQCEKTIKGHSPVTAVALRADEVVARGHSLAASKRSERVDRLGFFSKSTTGSPPSTIAGYQTSMSSVRVRDSSTSVTVRLPTWCVPRVVGSSGATGMSADGALASASTVATSPSSVPESVDAGEGSVSALHAARSDRTTKTVQGFMSFLQMGGAA